MLLLLILFLPLVPVHVRLLLRGSSAHVRWRQTAAALSHPPFALVTQCLGHQLPWGGQVIAVARMASAPLPHPGLSPAIVLHG